MVPFPPRHKHHTSPPPSPSSSRSRLPTLVKIILIPSHLISSHACRHYILAYLTLFTPQTSPPASSRHDHLFASYYKIPVPDHHVRRPILISPLGVPVTSWLSSASHPILSTSSLIFPSSQASHNNCPHTHTHTRRLTVPINFPVPHCVVSVRHLRSSQTSPSLSQLRSRISSGFSSSQSSRSPTWSPLLLGTNIIHPTSISIVFPEPSPNPRHNHPHPISTSHLISCMSSLYPCLSHIIHIANISARIVSTRPSLRFVFQDPRPLTIM